MKKLDFIITYTGLLFPYRLRIYYGILLNFLVGPLNTLKQLWIAINRLFILALLSFVYYLAVPITILLRPRAKKMPFRTIRQEINHKNIFRMF